MPEIPSGVKRTATAAREGLSTFAALVLAGIMMVSVIDVAGRYVFNRPLPGSSEITEILMAILIYAGLPVVSQRNAHITVDLLDTVTPPSLARVRDAIVRLLSVFVLAVVAWRLWAYADQIRDSKDVTEYLKLPLAPFCHFMSILAGIAAVVEAVRIARPAAQEAATTT
jgi:TRAP-type C4-dicarboxylate transport system permease small subunit